MHCRCHTWAVGLSCTSPTQDTTPPQASFNVTQPASDASQVASLSWQAQDASAVIYQCRLNASSPTRMQQHVHALSPAGDLPGPPLALGQWLPCTPPLQLYWLCPGATPPHAPSGCAQRARRGLDRLAQLPVPCSEHIHHSDKELAEKCVLQRPMYCKVLQVFVVQVCGALRCSRLMPPAIRAPPI